MTAVQARATVSTSPDHTGIEVAVDLGPRHGGWAAVDSWTVTPPLVLAEELRARGWEAAGELHEHTVEVRPSDWAAILKAATSTKAERRQLAERTDTAWNLLVAETPSKDQGGLSVLQIAELTHVGRHRVYALRGLGKSKPKFSLEG